MPVLGMNLFDIMIVRQYLDEIEAISLKYNSKREEVIAMADSIEKMKVNGDIA